MKIITGDFTDFDGEVKLYDGVTVGYLAQEPELDEDQDVKGNILDGIPDKKALLEEFYEVIKASSVVMNRSMKKWMKQAPLHLLNSSNNKLISKQKSKMKN